MSLSSALREKCGREDALVYSLVFGMFVASVLEGFLLDAFSLPGIVNFCLVMDVDCIMKEKQLQELGAKQLGVARRASF